MAFLDETTLSGMDRFSAFQRRGELHRLQKIVKADEKLVRIVEGRATKVGVLGLTDQRVVWISGTMPWHKPRIFPLWEITAVRGAGEGDRAIITIESEKLTLVLTSADRDAAMAFVDDATQSAHSQGNEELRVLKQNPKPAPDGLTPDEVEEKLAKVEKMHEQGSMTSDEAYRARMGILKRRQTMDQTLDPPTGSWWRRF